MYKAFKLKSFNHWLWFEEEKVTKLSNGDIEAVDGWGLSGCLIKSITFDSNLIEAEMVSKVLMYSGH